MIFYILQNQIATLFVALGLITTLSFDSEILSYVYGGGESELYSSLTQDNKTLVLKPKKDELDSNLLVQTKQGNFYFDLKSNKANPHKFITVKAGVVNQSYRQLKTMGKIEVWEGESSLLIKNNSNSQIIVNGTLIQELGQGHASKGAPLMINSQRVLN